MTAPSPTYGVDLGGTNLRAAVVDAEGAIVDDETCPAPDSGVVDAIHGLLVALRDRNTGAGRAGPGRVGVGAAGMVDRAGVVHFAPNLPALRGVALAADLAAAFGEPVAVDNDANVAAIAEAVHGAARGRDDVLVITLGTGIGGGIVAGGKLLRGAHGFAAEIGHFQVDPAGPRCACGQVGHWEAVASGTALRRLSREWAEAGRLAAILAVVDGDASAVTGEHVAAAAGDGDADAIALLRHYSANVAVGLAGLVNILDPEVVVIGGGLVQLGELLLGPVREELASRIEGGGARPPVEVVAAALGERAGVVGAAVLARDLPTSA